jgi:hypothetical protein
MKTHACPLCGQLAPLTTRPGHLRRGNRTIAYTKQVWVCEQCEDPDTGETPFRFVDFALMADNEAAAAVAWERHYGEPLPPGQRPGRPTEAFKSERITVLFSPAELVHLDQVRGEKTRSEFIRERILKAS